jgi:hypothetical protein
MNFTALVILLDIDQLMIGQWLKGKIPDEVFDFGEILDTSEIANHETLKDDIEREQKLITLRNIHITYQKTFKISLFFENLVAFICSLTSILFCTCMLMYTLTFIYN